MEVALFYPWAAVFRAVQLPALIAMLEFFGLLLIGYVYLWRFGYLEWVRSNVTTTLAGAKPAATENLHQQARRDPDFQPPNPVPADGFHSSGK